MKIGFLFPGQGAQTVGMGKDLYEKYEEVRKIYDEAQKITGIDIKQISFEGPEEVLRETKNTQIATLVESLAILEILKKNNIRAELSAGLSLGEYTALIENGIFDFETGIKLVQKRGEIMQNLIPKGNWKMSSILGLDTEIVEGICKEIKDGFVVPTNYNTKGHVVVSGEESAVEKVELLAKEKGVRKTITVKTSGPFHTEKLQDSSKALREELQKININSDIDFKVIKNLDGKLYNKNDNLVDILSKHIVSPVRFTTCLKTMYDAGIDTFIEVGPGKMLSGFVKRMEFDKELKILNINNCINLEKTLEEVKNNE